MQALPHKPFLYTVTFHHVNHYIDIATVISDTGLSEDNVTLFPTAKKV